MNLIDLIIAIRETLGPDKHVNIVDFNQQPAITTFVEERLMPNFSRRQARSLSTELTEVARIANTNIGDCDKKQVRGNWNTSALLSKKYNYHFDKRAYYSHTYLHSAYLHIAINITYDLIGGITVH